MINIYGIPNCGSVKKALTWFDEHKIEYTFHNFKKEGLQAQDLDAWLKACGQDVVVNRKGLSWRKLDDEAKGAANEDPQFMRQLLLDNPTLIKRPVVVLQDGKVIIGVNEEAWAQAAK